MSTTETKIESRGDRIRRMPKTLDLYARVFDEMRVPDSDAGPFARTCADTMREMHAVLLSVRDADCDHFVSSGTFLLPQDLRERIQSLVSGE